MSMQDVSVLPEMPLASGVVGNISLSSRERLRELVAEILSTQSQITSFSDDDTLVEIGITSVDMVTLLLAVESTFNVEVPQHEITAETFRSIATVDALLGRLGYAA
ncbi:MAG TPA: phosphopantetheine-binding protein [Rhodopila sp.]|uniref:phosphopantetheine-binding protein n=1 Tax=Rhodopila sp. TaxID=2480087 RepID=UPI002C413A3E|nr:phosphopantetheine-binding protein [Rhodopila sp.]HVY14540.1 phosphopantetheine-binding protein [Rhodopila sp.]